MKYKSEIQHLKKQLQHIENELIGMITEELKGRNNIVPIPKESYPIFREDIQPYMESIQLGESGEVIIITSYADVKVKLLSTCLYDGEIDYWNLIDLLEYLLRNTQTGK